MVKSLALIAPMGLGHGVDGQFLQSLVNVQSVDESLRLLQQLFVRKQLVNKMLAKRLLDHLNKTWHSGRLVKARRSHQRLGK